jgi:hypothetical protein
MSGTKTSLETMYQLQKYLYQNIYHVIRIHLRILLVERLNRTNTIRQGDDPEQGP